MKRCAFVLISTLLCAAGLLRAADAPPATCPTEPNINTALSWWPAPRGVWTPIGWKDHLFRFNVIYNGTILCAPSGGMAKPHIAQYANQNVQLNFTPSGDGAIPPLPSSLTRLYRMDGGIGDQRWRPGSETPVLQTDYPCQEGVVLRQEVFAHLKGGQAIETGVEPLYAWVRLSVAYVDPVRAPKKFYFGVQLSRCYTHNEYPFSLDDSVSIAAQPKDAKLPRTLTSDTPAGKAGEAPGLLISEPDGKTRLLIPPGGAGPVTFTETAKDSHIYAIKVELPVTEGAHTDLLIPVLSGPREEVDAEASLGFDGALAQCENFWKEKPATAARIHVPEPYINEAIARNIQFAQVIAERNPDNGEYSFLSGSYGYDALWSTPTSMVSHMFLDLLGYHDVVERHVALYKAHQGELKPPGPAYKKSPGYFSTPRTLTTFDWLTDHGAILELLSRHALMTGDSKFIDNWLDPIVKGCEFIKESCAATDHKGAKGVMPPAVATDTNVPTQAVWNQAWNYKGLTTAVQLLKRLDHPRAAEFQQTAGDFKSAFDRSFRDVIEHAPSWKDANGQSHPVPQANLIPATDHHIFDDAFLLDTGPMVLPWAGLYDANDPAMRSFADYFRAGPPTKLWGPRSSPIARASLKHEISSCEPCYSWNIVNSWRAGDREKFIEGMYSLFAGAISPQTFINCEHRNAMYGTLFVAPLMTWSLRQSVVDDQLVDGELHLMRLIPRAWFVSGEATVFENMPTIYGPVDLKWQLSDDGKMLAVTYANHWRTKPGKVVLHAPPIAGIQGVTVNGKSFTFGADRSAELVD